ncbi:MAG: DnaJ domain-containing protein [Saprospiraceae bacterium]|nr:DnaJ domain-containing protein [Saprospiraceae bacterium]
MLIEDRSMMDYFKFYEIPVSFSPDMTEIRRKYLVNSKQYHPDFFTQESESRQDEILKLSSLNNEAYKVLSDEDLRMKYILESEKILTEENKNDIPQDFLMDMMDFNEKLMELEFDFSPEILEESKNELQQIENQLRNEVASILKKKTITEASEEELLEVKNYYLKKRYLLRISEKLATFASR